MRYGWPAFWMTWVGVGLGRMAYAATLVAPVGAPALVLEDHRVACPEGSELQGWSIEAEGRQLRPPAKLAGSQGVAKIKVANQASQCAIHPSILQAMAIAHWPEIDASSVILNVDAGRVDIKGHHLQGTVLHWTSGSRSGQDTCRDPHMVEHQEICAFAIDRDVSASPGGVDLYFLPTDVPVQPPDAMAPDAMAYDAQGHLMALNRFHLPAARIVLLSLVAADASMDVHADVARMALKHPEAVGSVACAEAICQMDGQDVTVRGEHGTDERLDIHFELRPHVFLQQGTQLEMSPTLVVPLQRCPVTVASAPPLRGIGRQKVVLKVGGWCNKAPSLRFFVSGTAAPVLLSHLEAEHLYVVLQVDNIHEDEAVISLQRSSGGLIGVTRTPTRLMPTMHARLELPGYGDIDFIPTNRDAHVALPSLGEGGTWVPLAVDGVYSVMHDHTGVDRVRGMAGTTGWVALRLAYRDPSLPPALREIDLAEVSDAVNRSIHAANLPMMLGAAALAEKPLVELLCGDGSGRSVRLTPAQTVSVPYEARDTCRLVLHSELIHPEDGNQALRITVTVSSAGGAPRAEAYMDQPISLRPGSEPRYIYLSGVLAPFDRVVVRVAVLADGTHYSGTVTDTLNAPQVQWSVIMGTARLRLYVTTSFPSGLFRIADAGHSGMLGLNAGALLRFVWLLKEGTQSPVGLETGLMWMGIAGDTTASAHGQMALVCGVGLGVPIANVSQMTQASISLHAWFEYELSRAIWHQEGSPMGFILGPSFSVGDVGVNF